MKLLPTILVIALATVSYMPTASAVGTSCAVSNKTPTCDFECLPGDYITVTASSDSDHFDTTVSGNCGGAGQECTATKESGCNETSLETASAGGPGICKINGSGTGSCTAHGGEPDDGTCINLVVTCLDCPEAICQTAGETDPCSIAAAGFGPGTIPEIDDPTDDLPKWDVPEEFPEDLIERLVIERPGTCGD